MSESQTQAPVYKRRSRSRSRTRAYLPYKKQSLARFIKPGTIHRFDRTYSFTQTVDDRDFQETTLSFILTNLPNYTEFTTLFDCFRIRGVTVKLLYDFTSSNVTGGAINATTAMPSIGYVYDYDDATNLGSETAYQQYDNFKYKLLDKPIICQLRPKPATALYGGGAFTQYAQARDLWVDCTNPGVVYYGMKYFVYNPLGGGGTVKTGQLKGILTYHIECKSTR